ncbi:MAG: hypothetical protein LBD58_02085 [Treponema sp.]|jgi:hypothetical protein|nr:hypothetical protein [Treponema sp.]
MDYEDASLEAMSREELLVAAKHLRDRIRDGYSFLITDCQNRVKSAKTGQYVSFSAFVETGNFRERFLEYIKEK